MTKPDLSEFDAAERSTTGGQRLKVDVILQALDDEQRAALRAALSGNYRPAVVAKVVTGWGHPIGDDAVKKWRAKNGGA